MGDLDDVFNELDNLGSFGVEEPIGDEDFFGDDFLLDDSPAVTAAKASSSNEVMKTASASASIDSPSSNNYSSVEIPTMQPLQVPTLQPLEQAIPSILAPFNSTGTKESVLPVVEAPAGFTRGSIAIGSARLHSDAGSVDADDNDDESVNSSFTTLKAADGVSPDFLQQKARATTFIGGKPVELQKSMPNLSAPPKPSILSRSDSPRRLQLREARSAIWFHERAIIVDKDDSGVEVAIVEKPVKRVLVASVNALLEGRVTTAISGGFAKSKKLERLFLVLRPLGLFFYKKPTKYNYVAPSHGTEFVVEKEKLKSVEAVVGSEVEFKITTTKNKVHVCQCPETIARDEWVDHINQFIQGTLSSTLR